MGSIRYGRRTNDSESIAGVGKDVDVEDEDEGEDEDEDPRWREEMRRSWHGDLIRACYRYEPLMPICSCDLIGNQLRDIMAQLLSRGAVLYRVVRHVAVWMR